jgi:chromosome segregation ATPase
LNLESFSSSRSNIPLYSPETHLILCDKNYNNLQWYLLAPKEINIKTVNSYHDLFWIEKTKIINDLNKYNKFISEMDEENQRIQNTISKIEEKDNIINQLNIQIKKLNKIYHSSTMPEGDISIKSDILSIKKNKSQEEITGFSYLNKDSNHNKEDDNNKKVIEGIPIEKLNLVLKQLNDSERRYQKLQEDNIKLKRRVNEKNNIENSIINEKNNSEFIDDDVEGVISEISDDKKNNKNKNEKNIHNLKKLDNMNSNINEELNNTKNQLILIKSLFRELDTKYKAIKSEIKKLFSGMIFKKNEIEIVNNILSLLDFNNQEINEIINNNH